MRGIFRCLAMCGAIGLLVGSCGSVWAGDVTGHWRERTVKGYSGSPWHELYEWNAFCTPAGAGSTQTCRTGACQGTLTHDGTYIFPGIPNGQATIYCDQPNFFAAPKVNTITVSGSTYVDTMPNTDYHMAFGQKMDPWGSEPWDWHSGTWYQTFVATGTGINRVSFKLAAPASTVRVRIHRSDGGQITSWPQVGPTREVGAACTTCDLWVAWRFGEVQTTVGATYAVSFSAVTGSISFFVHRDSVGPGYSQGTAHKDNTAQNYDLYAIIFSDNDGTLLTYQMESPDIGPATEWAGAWAQSFTATGTSLAAVGLFAQNNVDPSWPAQVRIYEYASGTITGTLVGPIKNLIDAGWYGPGTAFGGMSYVRGEVPLVPGRQYVIVFSPYDIGQAGFVPLRRPGGDVLPGGTAYMGRGGAWEARTFDLSMTIMEYSGGQVPTPVPSATPTRTPTRTATPVVNRSVVELR